MKRQEIAHFLCTVRTPFTSPASPRIICMPISFWDGRTSGGHRLVRWNQWLTHAICRNLCKNLQGVCTVLEKENLVVKNSVRETYRVLEYMISQISQDHPHIPCKFLQDFLQMACKVARYIWICCRNSSRICFPSCRNIRIHCFPCAGETA